MNPSLNKTDWWRLRPTLVWQLKPSMQDTMVTTQLSITERQNRPHYQGTAGHWKIMTYLLLEIGQSILAHARPYNPVTKVCRLCLKDVYLFYSVQTWDWDSITQQKEWSFWMVQTKISVDSLKLLRKEKI